MLQGVFKKVKKKVVSWLYAELNQFEYVNHTPAEKKYQECAIVGERTSFSVSARIYNHLNDIRRIKIGNNCLIYGDILIYNHGGRVEIGDFVFVGENSRIWSALSIKIGNNVLISHNVNIHDNNSHPLNSAQRKSQSEIILTKGLPDTGFGVKEKEIIIEDDVWIGYNASIGKGVRLGKGCIIAAGSYVYKDVPSYAIVMGNPATIVSNTD